MRADLLGSDMKLQFAPYELDTDRAELRTVSGLIKLEPKAFRLLCLLVENNERVISKEEMIAAVWGGRFISDAAVSTALKAVRKAIGDDGNRQEFIQTIRGVGHRFVAPVRIRPGEVSIGAAAPHAERPAAFDGRGEKPTVAVLPFGRIGLPDDFASLGDAIPADIISSLARLRWLRVIARESTFRFRQAEVDLAALHGVLGANYCLSGRVELFGKRLAVSVDLVDTRSGGLIWSDCLERPIADVHAIRHDIVGAVIAALDLQIPQAEAALARTKPVEHLDAWEAYHLGLSHVYRFNAHDNAIAGSLFLRATELDPGFSAAFAARAFTSFQDVMMGYVPDRRAALDAARFAAERSMDLDPLDPYANAAMGRLHILTGTLDDGLVWLDRSVELSPNYAKGHYARAFLQVLRCQTGETRAGIETAIGLSPIDPLLAPMRSMKALSFGIDGDYASAADWAVLSARTAPSHSTIVITAIGMCQLDGRADDAAHWVRIVRETRPDYSIAHYVKSLPFAKADFFSSIRSALRAAGIPD